MFEGFVSGLGAMHKSCGNEFAHGMVPATGARPKLRNGFTMIELMVTLAIAAILVAIGLPYISAPRTSSEANGLQATLEYARSTAIKQGRIAVVCSSIDGATCNTLTPSWATGWIVVVPVSGTCTAAAGDPVLQSQPALTGNDTANWHTLAGAIGAGGNSFCYNRLGFQAAAYNGLVEFKTTPVKAAKSRCVIVSGVGHTQVVASGASDALNNACP